MGQDNTNQQNNEQLELQARQLVSALDVHAKRLSMRTLKQLENGRSRAVKAHAEQLAGVDINADGTLSQLAHWALQHRLMVTGLLLAMVISSFVLMQAMSGKESSDAFLLSAELPPEAFVDKGFEPSLNVPAAHLQQKT